MSERDARFEQAALAVGLDPRADIKIGGHYTPVLSAGTEVWISGQIPRVGDVVRHVGALGAGLGLAEGQLAARTCGLRALALLQRELGSLDRVAQVLRLTVYVRSAPDFTQQSEVADGVSDLLAEVLGPAGLHTRTSVGVAQLPKGAAVEVDLVVRAAEAGADYA